MFKELKKDFNRI